MVKRTSTEQTYTKDTPDRIFLDQAPFYFVLLTFVPLLLIDTATEPYHHDVLAGASTVQLLLV